MSLDTSATGAVTHKIVPLHVRRAYCALCNGSIEMDKLKGVLSTLLNRSHRVGKGTCYTASAQVNADAVAANAKTSRRRYGSKCMLGFAATRIGKPALGTGGVRDVAVTHEQRRRRGHYGNAPQELNFM
jgi:hypothetical protein